MSKAITATDDTEAIRAELMQSADEAEELSQLFYRCAVADLDYDRAKELRRIVRSHQRERAQRSNPAPNTCWQCGNATTSGECVSCHEGYSVSEFNHIRPVSFGITERPFEFPKQLKSRANLHPQPRRVSNLLSK